MVQFMGRENMEDYNADFLCMLETWEAGVRFLETPAKAGVIKPIKIAELLGCIRCISKSRYRDKGGCRGCQC